MDSLSRLVTPGIKLTALGDELGLRKQDYAELRSILFDLVEEGIVHVLSGGAFALAPTGRPNDPRGKPLPEPPRTPTLPKKAVAKPAAKPKRTRDSTLPWKPAARPQPVRHEEYDPETGEIRVVAPAGLDVKPAGDVGRRRRDTADHRPSSEARRSRRDSGRLGSRRTEELRGEGAPNSVSARIAGDPEEIIGRITVHPAGYGFVQTDAAETIFVPAKYRNLSLDGDRVAVATWPGVRGTEGRVVEVLARGRARLTGILRRVGRAVYLEPDDPRIAADYGRVGVDDAPHGKDGDAVVVEITRYPDAARRELAGKVLKVLGDPEDPRTEIEKILACAVIPIEFPDEATAQAVVTSQELGAADLADRIDLRDRRFCTIDPETARDFDDALCIEDGPHGGPRVWVAVADVSHYVRWGDALDKEATIRGVSVYLPDRVIPMLPHQLSAGICSLNPLVDRCAMVARLDYSEAGELQDVGYAAAVIRSKARLDYPGVAAALGGDFRGQREAYRPWETELQRLHALARILRKKRQARGALELDLPEPKVVLDSDDPRLVRDVVRAKGDPAVKQAYQLVEEYMIAANEAVGSFFRRRNAPTVWRVHAPPKADRVAQLAELLGAYGIVVVVEEATTPLGMKAVLDQIADKPGAQALSFLVLRTLTQAVWDTVPIGHFGLASGDYLHFTSPIRRYPDLLVHRLLKYHLHRDGQPSGGGYAKPPPPVETLAELAQASSAHERRAMEAEREAVAMYRAYLMRDQVGERFNGVVSAVTNFGAFVEIEEPYVEGLIKLDTLGDEPWDFDAIHMRLSGRKTGKMIELGDKVTVDVQNVSVIRRRIDFVVHGVTHAGKRPGKSDERRAPRPEQRAGLSKARKAGREVERATRGQSEGGARRATPARGKLQLGVSHRGMREREATDGGKRRAKPPKKRR